MAALSDHNVEDQVQPDTLERLLEQIHTYLAEQAGTTRGQSDRALPGDGKTYDVDLSRHATHLIDRHFMSEAMDRRTVTPLGRVSVQVSDGWATVTGTVDYACQRTAVDRLVSDIPGVVGVTNLIQVSTEPI